MALKFFKKGDVVRLHGTDRLLLVTKDSHDNDKQEVFSGVILSGGNSTHPVGRHDDDYVAESFQRVSSDLTVVFKSRSEPRWRKGDLFEFKDTTGQVRRSFAIDHDTEPHLGAVTIPCFAGYGAAYLKGSERKLGININEVEPRA